MRNLFVLALAVTSAAALAQNPIFSNRSSNPRVPALNASPVSEQGTAAPAGEFWSELQHDAGNTTGSNTTLGSSAHFVNTAGSNQFRLADDFTPNCAEWVITGIRTYCYATSVTTPVSTSANVKFWNTTPVGGGSTIASFDSALATGTYSATDIFQATPTATGRVWRIGNTHQPVINTAPATNRRIWQNTLTFATPVSCVQGTTYWADFQTTVLAPAVSNFYPLATIQGTRSVTGMNSLQLQFLNSITDTYVAVLDLGNPAATEPDYAMDVPFILLGKFVCKPTSFNQLEGDFFTGGIPEVQSSNDDYLVMYPDTINSTLRAVGEFITPAPVTTADSVTTTCELSVGRPGLSYAVSLYDGQINGYAAPFSSGTAPATDTVVTNTALGAAATRLVEDGSMAVRFTFAPINDEDPATDGWAHNIDAVSWVVVPIP